MGASVTGAGGSFKIDYREQQRSQVVLYLLAGRPAAARLAAVLGTPPVRGPVVVNERTTVAAGFALAQFVTGLGVAGRAPGPQNASLMAADLVDVRRARWAECC